MNRNTTKLHPDLQEALRNLILQAKAIDMHIFLVEGHRTPERQRELYAQGRTTPGQIVTYTLQSKHLTGQAIDVAFDPKYHGQPYPEDNELWTKLGKLGEKLGLIRGGRRLMRDMGHFELPTPPETNRYQKIYRSERVGGNKTFQYPEQAITYLQSLEKDELIAELVYLITALHGRDEQKKNS